MLSLPRNILCILLAGSLSINIAQGVPLLGGRYETTTDVQAFLNLALDTALMKETSDLDTKKDLYKHVSFVLIHSRINLSLSAASFFFLTEDLILSITPTVGE